MATLTFPSGQAMGTLDWAEKRTAPVLASVTVPDGREIALDVQVIESVRRVDGHGAFHSTLTH